MILLLTLLACGASMKGGLVDRAMVPSSENLDSDVEAAWGRWKTRYLAPTPDGCYRVLFEEDPDAPTVSEGQGYGMLLAVLMADDDPDAQVIFDGLYAYFDRHRSKIDRRLMDWYVNADESIDNQGDDSAFDGDADIAYSLLLAHARWGTGGAPYRSYALEIIAGIQDSEIGPQSDLPMLGDWVEPDGAKYSQWTVRSSDFMPGHFRAFADATGNDRWKQVRRASLAAVSSIQESSSPKTGLLPDFLVVSVDGSAQPAESGFLEGPNDGNYYYNAGRCPWRLGIDAVTNGDADVWDPVLRISTWFMESTGGDPSKIRSGYQLDGTPLPNSDYFTGFFAAPVGVAAMTGPEQSWLNAIYKSVKNLEEGYYPDSVALLSMIVMTGRWIVP